MQARSQRALSSLSCPISASHAVCIHLVAGVHMCAVIDIRHWQGGRWDEAEGLSASGTAASARVILKAERPAVRCRWRLPTALTDLRDGPEALFAMGAPWAIPTVECPEVIGR